MRQDSLNINLLGGVNLDELALIVNGVVDNVQTRSIAEELKNKQGSGRPEAGTVEYKRLANATLEDKGTARTGGAGAQVSATPIQVNLNTDKEIVEELQIKDVELYGVENLVGQRAVNHARQIQTFLDRAFFTEAKNAGTKFVRGNLTKAEDIVDAMIVNAKSVESDFIDGIDAEDLALVLSPEYRKALKNHMDALPQGTDATNGRIGMYDGVEVFETHRLPENVKAVIMLKGAIAQPYFVSDYRAEKINLDDAVAVQAFLYTGVKALTPEAIIYDEA